MNFDAFKRTAAVQGILLEHVSEAIINANASFTKVQSGINEPLPIPENPGAEVDAYCRFEAPKLYGDFSEAVGANKGLHFLVQCKGHARDGFLMLRKSSRYLGKYSIYGFKPFGNVHERYANISWVGVSRCEPVGTDWGYFYKGTMSGGGEMAIYPQDREGAQNKFNEGIRQLRENVVGWAARRDLEAVSDKERMEFAVPVLVCNVPIYLLEFDSPNNKVKVFQNVPWTGHVNPPQPGSKVSPLDLFFVVTVTALKDFCRWVYGGHPGPLATLDSLFWNEFKITEDGRLV